MKKTFLIALVFISFSVFSQKDTLTSLHKQLELVSDNENKVDLLNKISKTNYIKGSTESIIPFAKKALTLANKLNYKKGSCAAYINLGTAYKTYGENQQALNFFKKALKISREETQKKKEANILEYIGLIYESEDDYEKALNIFLQALKIRENIKDVKGISNSYNCMGIIFYNLSRDDEALDYYYKSLKIREELKDSLGIAELYNNIGILYLAQNKIDAAIIKHKESLLIKEKFQDKNGIALSYNNLGLCYKLLKKPKQALFYHTKSLSIYEELKDKKGIALSSFNIGADYLKLGNHLKATNYAQQSLTISQNIKNLFIENSAYTLFFDIALKKRDYKKALYYQKLKTAINDSIYNIESNKNIAELNTKYETELKDKELIKLEKEKEVKQLEIDKQKSLKYTLLIVISALIIIVTAMVLFTILIKKTSNKLELANQALTKRNVEIEQKKEEINKLEIQITKHQTQMNPHFIFNAINGLQHLILEGDKISAINQIQSFSKLLRLTLNNSETNYLSIQNEIDYLYKYVEFELHTFYNKFDFTITANSEIDLEAKIPTMLIQPMIENAIKYADLEDVKNGEINVAFKLLKLEETLFLKITIKDNGKGLNNKQSAHTSKGISITKHRIGLELKKSNYAITDYFSIKSPIEDNLPGTKVTMLIPYLN